MALANNSKINLFSPIKMGDMELKNRIIMAPLTRNRAGDGNVPQDINIVYYEQRSGAGLIITEGSQITERGIGYPGTPGIYSQDQITGWKRITDAVHAKGGHIFIQLWHTGRISHSSLLPNGELPVAPSAIRANGDAVTYQGNLPFETPRALETSELQGIVKDYEVAAINAMKAGFDGVEVHAANGYLLDQFLRDSTNHREDQYGGSVDNRMRLLREVVEIVVEVCGHNRVAVRLSPENPFNDIKDSQPQHTFTAVANMLSSYPLAYLHVLEGDMMTGDSLVNYNELRKSHSGRYMANNGYNADNGNSAIENGGVDMVAFGKMFLANPDLPERFAQGADLNAPDYTTFYGGGEEGYIDYPAL